MKRNDHLVWAKARALEILFNKNNALTAWVSFVSDLQKHDELKNHIAIALGNMTLPKDRFAISKYRDFIQGFN